jgi:DNA-binding beta-propeller fold protein YncE
MIRWCVIGLLGLATACAAPVVAAPPALELVGTIDMPGVKGRIDHLDADPATHRLFVAALGNDSVEVLDTTGHRNRSVSGMSQPQGVLYVPESNRLLVANGGGSRVDLLDAASLATVRRIDGMRDADNVRYDQRTRVAWVGYGDGALRAMDPASGASHGEIALPGHPESFQLERSGDRAFVNVPSAHAVVVVDRRARKPMARWETPWATQNYPMALDEEGRRLFVGARSPPVLLVYDTGSGNVIARLPIGKDSDDVFFDAERKRVYVICGEGKVDVFRQETPDRYVLEDTIVTAPRARTGLFVPMESKLYVAAPAAASAPARVLVYHTR